jgi:hypothetical protein
MSRLTHRRSRMRLLTATAVIVALAVPAGAIAAQSSGEVRFPTAHQIAIHEGGWHLALAHESQFPSAEQLARHRGNPAPAATQAPTSDHGTASGPGHTLPILLAVLLALGMAALAATTRAFRPTADGR